MNWNLITPLIPFALGIIFKTLLDLNLAKFIVKYLYWIPTRWTFGMKPESLKGNWIQHWESNNSEKYKAEPTRKSRVELKQFSKYIYGEFRVNNDEEYYVFGQVIGKSVVGIWGDCKSELGYFGTFELRIVDNNNLQGKWLGHSNERPDLINTDDWIWHKS